MTDLPHYESLLKEWRDKEETARLMREFRDTGGEFRLKVAVINADPMLGHVAGPIIDKVMARDGWRRLVDVAVKNAEHEANIARSAFETVAHNAIVRRQPL